MTDKSTISQLIPFFRKVSGDLANITAPPFILAPKSVTECGTCWTERPSIFIAPALESSAERRALLVLKWVLVALKAQFYIGCDGETTKSIKKPINAFLGELFFGEWKDDSGCVKLTAEQISHHPPMTAVYMRSEEFGIRGEGYTRVEMTFNGTISIVQTGHAVLHIDKYEEDHLIFLPNAKVKGFLSGCLYPELTGTYHIVSSSGYITVLRFYGTGVFSSLPFSGREKANSFEARIYHRDDPTKSSIFTGKGQWSDKFAFFDKDKREIDAWDHAAVASQPGSLVLLDESEMDGWETRKAWSSVIRALMAGKFREVIAEKSKIETAQRSMRKEEQRRGVKWEPLLFSRMEPSDYQLWDQLAVAVGWELKPEKTNGVWKYDFKKAERAMQPYHGSLTPLGDPTDVSFHISN